MNIPTAVQDARDQPHASAGKYAQIAVILFVLTALEVSLFEVAHEAGATGFGAYVASPVGEHGPSHFVVFLLVLSAIKFWCVAMFYMHLKFDLKLLRYVFGFSLFIAVVVIGALFTLFTYNRTLWWWSGVWK
jgi:hypothetical protein